MASPRLLSRLPSRLMLPLLAMLMLLLVMEVAWISCAEERLLATPGHQWSSAPSATSPAASAVHCALLCLTRPDGCAGADFCRRTRVCRLQPGASVQPLQPPVLHPAPADCVALQRAASCLQLQRLGYRRDGVYQAPGAPVPLLCDMTLTLGGGWTLLVTSASLSGWTLDTVLERNTDQPSIDDDYSILRHGDSIKALGTSNRFRYRLEALTVTEPGRERWGGVWLADRSHTLTGITSNQTSVRELTFDQWPAGVRVPHDVVPWLNRGTHQKPEPMLTASIAEDRYWWGSIVANGSAWIAYTEAEQPDTILYWIRED